MTARLQLLSYHACWVIVVGIRDARPPCGRHAGSPPMPAAAAAHRPWRIAPILASPPARRRSSARARATGDQRARDRRGAHRASASSNGSRPRPPTTRHSRRRGGACSCSRAAPTAIRSTRGPARARSGPGGRSAPTRAAGGPSPSPASTPSTCPRRSAPRASPPTSARVGLKYGDEWHLAHFWNPPMVVPGSIMGGFSGLFDRRPEPVQIVDGDDGRPTLERTAGHRAPVRLRQPGADQADAERAGRAVRADARQGQVPADLDPQRRVHRR